MKTQRTRETLVSWRASGLSQTWYTVSTILRSYLKLIPEAEVYQTVLRAHACTSGHLRREERSESLVVRFGRGSAYADAMEGSRKDEYFRKYFELLGHISLPVDSGENV